MENLFLEILRILDLKFNNNKDDKDDKFRNSDFYFIPLEYNKLLLSNNEINMDKLNNIVEDKHYYYKTSLFSVSKLDADSIYVKSIDYENPETNFYKSRDIILYLCLFLKYLNFLEKFNKEYNYEVEHKFINKFVKDSNINLFMDTLNALYCRRNNLDLYNKLTDIFKGKGFENKENLVTESITDCLRLSINLYFYSNSFDIGFKESLRYNFETVIFYIILTLMTTDLNKIKLSTIYLNIENSY